MKIAFDVDDTLIVPAVISATGRDCPNYHIINIFRFFQEQGHEMFIWSGGGIDYAKSWSEKLGLDATILEKTKNEAIDICFDDCDVDLAKVNIKVKRIKNSVSRKEWNNHVDWQNKIQE